MNEEVTAKIEPLERPNPHKRVAEHIQLALRDACDIGHDIEDALTKLLASVRRRESENEAA